MPLFIFVLNFYDYWYFLLAVVKTFVGFGKREKKGKKGGYVGFGFAFLYLRKMMKWFVTLLMGRSYNRFFCIGAVCGGCRANVDEVEEETKTRFN